MLFRFRRMRAMDPLQVAMTGVRMGERILQVGCDDVVLLTGLATKVGLSGSAALAVATEEEAQRGRAAGAKAGALLDVRVGPLTALGFDDAAFDMAVVDDTAGRFSRLASADRLAALRELRRVLRPGGRAEVIERLAGGGWFGGRVEPAADWVAAGGAEGALTSAGFGPVRQLIEKDGFRFVEGLRG